MMNSKRLGAILMILLLAAASGCATAVNGTTQEVTFSSDPLGATVYVDGTEVGNTPTAANLARNTSHSIRIEKPGYVPYETTTVLVQSGWSALDNSWPWPLDLLVGGVESAADSKLGGLYEIRPTDISAELLPGIGNATATNLSRTARPAAITSTTEANISPSPPDTPHEDPAKPL